MLFIRQNGLNKRQIFFNSNYTTFTHFQNRQNTFQQQQPRRLNLFEFVINFPYLIKELKTEAEL
jgi:hypothetical protein